MTPPPGGVRVRSTSVAARAPPTKSARAGPRNPPPSLRPRFPPRLRRGPGRTRRLPLARQGGGAGRWPTGACFGGPAGRRTRRAPRHARPWAPPKQSPDTGRGFRAAVRHAEGSDPGRLPVHVTALPELRRTGAGPESCAILWLPGPGLAWHAPLPSRTPGRRSGWQVAACPFHDRPDDQRVLPGGAALCRFGPAPLASGGPGGPRWGARSPAARLRPNPPVLACLLPATSRMPRTRPTLLPPACPPSRKGKSGGRCGPSSRFVRPNRA